MCGLRGRAAAFRPAARRPAWPNRPRRCRGRAGTGSCPATGSGASPGARAGTRPPCCRNWRRQPTPPSPARRAAGHTSRVTSSSRSAAAHASSSVSRTIRCNRSRCAGCARRHSAGPPPRPDTCPLHRAGRSARGVSGHRGGLRAGASGGEGRPFPGRSYRRRQTRNAERALKTVVVDEERGHPADDGNQRRIQEEVLPLEHGSYRGRRDNLELFTRRRSPPVDRGKQRRKIHAAESLPHLLSITAP